MALVLPNILYDYTETIQYLQIVQVVEAGVESATSCVAGRPSAAAYIEITRYRNSNLAKYNKSILARVTVIIIIISC